MEKKILVGLAPPSPIPFNLLPTFCMLHTCLYVTYLCSDILFSHSMWICLRLVWNPLLLSFTKVYMALSGFFVKTARTVWTLHIICTQKKL